MSRVFHPVAFGFGPIIVEIEKLQSMYFKKQICQVLIATKGHLISKCLFCVFNFFQKMNKNTSHSSKNEFINLFFGRIHGLKIYFRNYLTFNISDLLAFLR